MPVSEIAIDRIDWIQILIAMLQGAINVVQLGPGMKLARVIQAMPLSGLLPMPFVVVNNDLVEQKEIPIGVDSIVLGEGLDLPANSTIWTQTGFDTKIFKIIILSTNAAERSFYKDLIIATFRANLHYIFQPIGNDIVHSYKAIERQTAQSSDGMSPGFYAADVILEVTGTRNVTVFTSFGIIEDIDTFTKTRIWPDIPQPPEDEVVVTTIDPNTAQS
jgi:hypothetical protein